MDEPLPSLPAERPCVTVRCETDDYVYTGHDQRHCASFRLERVAIEP